MSTNTKIKKKKTDKRTVIIRVVALVLAALMVAGVCSVLFTTVFAAEVDDLASITTGSQNTPKWPIFAVVGAVFVIALCVALPKLKKK